MELITGNILFQAVGGDELEENQGVALRSALACFPRPVLWSENKIELAKKDPTPLQEEYALVENTRALRLAAICIVIIDDDQQRHQVFTRFTMALRLLRYLARVN